MLEFRHSLCEGNSDTNFLAKKGPNSGVWFTEVENFPINLHQYLLANALNIPLLRW